LHGRLRPSAEVPEVGSLGGGAGDVPPHLPGGSDLAQDDAGALPHSPAELRPPRVRPSYGDAQPHPGRGRGLMLRALVLDRADLSFREIPSHDLKAACERPDLVLWVDVEQPTDGDLER